MKRSALYTLVVLTYGLAACGGGGGGGGDDDNTPVNPPDNQAQQLSWIAPSTRTDGSFLDLSELAGFKIYSGPSSNNLELIADIEDGHSTSYDLSDMTPGNYFFGIVAYDTDGLNSPISDRIEKTITE
ncbi:MAG: fibronectin type III domain-containing protein [Chromatiales bacterium]|nr:fibronectin type III domain-containing protein [Chromatiales bacterium]